MSLNTAHADHGVLIHAGECILIFSDNVSVEFHGNDGPEFKGTKNGRMYLTTHRMIFNSKSPSDAMRSFSFPFVALGEVSVEQPLFGANFIKGKVRAQPNGNWMGEVKFKLTFKSGGAIDFGQAMLKVAQMATRGMSSGGTPPPYTPPAGPWYAAAPPAYTPAPQGYYGWVPPTHAFPDQPPPNSVFMSSAPPPYPGLASGQQQSGGFYDPNQSPPGYPGAQPGTANGYPGGYPGIPPNYPVGPTQGFSGGPGYPSAQGSAPPYPGVNPQQAGPYPGAASSGAPPQDAKAAEAAQSAYYDPNQPQTAFVPPPYYDQPPSYQQSQSKKDN